MMPGNSRCGRRLAKLLFGALLLSTRAVSYAQQPANRASEQEATLRAISFTSEKLSIWQRRLNLMDWDVAIVLSRAADLKPNTLGHISWDADLKTAVIRVLDPADYRLSQNAMLRDMELTIVHELMHLNLAPVLTEFRRSEDNRREEEEAINHLVDALLKLDSGNRGGFCGGVDSRRPEVKTSNALGEP